MVKSSHQQQSTTVALYLIFLQTENSYPITSKKLQTADLLILYKIAYLANTLSLFALSLPYCTDWTSVLPLENKTKQTQTTKCNELRITISCLKLNHLNKKLSKFYFQSCPSNCVSFSTV